MHPTRRSVIQAAGAGLAAFPAASAAAAAGDVPFQAKATELARVSEEANAALMRGDIRTYRSLVRLGDDFTLMSPFGGKPSRGSSFTETKWEEVGRFFRNGTLRQEVVESYATADMIALAVIERAHVAVGELPAQPWALRVTLIYRRSGEDWLLVHRHADPLAPGISVALAARMARGDPS